jgi:hypothetical protein
LREIKERRVSFREVDAEYGWRRLDTANTGAYSAVTCVDGVKGSQLLVERDRAVGNCHRTGFPDDDAIVLGGCQRLLVSM